MSEEGVQPLVGVENTVLGEVIGGLNRAHALAPRLLVNRLGTNTRRQRLICSPVGGYRHLQHRSLQWGTPSARVSERDHDPEYARNDHAACLPAQVIRP